MIDLRPQDRQIIIDQAQEAFSQGTQIWAYGSRIKGTSHNGSDLDLVIRAAQDQTLDLEQLDNFKAALQESNIPILVQALSWQHMPQRFQAGILKQHEVLMVVGEV